MTFPPIDIYFVVSRDDSVVSHFLTMAEARVCRETWNRHCEQKEKLARIVKCRYQGSATGKSRATPNPKAIALYNVVSTDGQVVISAVRLSAARRCAKTWNDVVEGWGRRVTVRKAWMATRIPTAAVPVPPASHRKANP